MSDSDKPYSIAPANQREWHKLYLFLQQTGQDADDTLIRAIKELPDCVSVEKDQRHDHVLRVVRNEHPAEPDAFELALIRLADEFVERLRRSGKLPH